MNTTEAPKTKPRTKSRKPSTGRPRKAAVDRALVREVEVAPIEVAAPPRDLAALPLAVAAGLSAGAIGAAILLSRRRERQSVMPMLASAVVARIAVGLARAAASTVLSALR